MQFPQVNTVMCICFLTEHRIIRLYWAKVCIALLGVLLIVTNSLINSNRNKLPNWANAVILGLIGFLALPTGGCSFMGAIFAFMIFAWYEPKYAIRYAVTMSVPTLIVMGIIELCVAVTKLIFFRR